MSDTIVETDYEVHDNVETVLGKHERDESFEELINTKTKTKKSGHEKKHNFCIQKSVFRAIVKELSDNRSFSEEAMNILHETTENYVINLFENARYIVKHSSRRTVLDTDIKFIDKLMMGHKIDLDKL